ncbi:hypothetical protein IFM89_007070 [Coptis chinensis]|uniref:Uncharacterized protein n=1 Tax=Coptis chinensis TaxID=261450 RepID=A0A835I9J8_9MAGN|nr:hypothetical protein IFM89_007070 [Coptis chinensis]
MEQGRATREHCGDLKMGEFGEKCDFDVDDTVQTLEKLGVVARYTIGRYYCVSLKCTIEIIGTTTEEMVLKAKQDATIA